MISRRWRSGQAGGDKGRAVVDAEQSSSVVLGEIQNTPRQMKPAPVIAVEVIWDQLLTEHLQVVAAIVCNKVTKIET